MVFAMWVTLGTSHELHYNSVYLMDCPLMVRIPLSKPRHTPGENIIHGLPSGIRHHEAPDRIPWYALGTP